MRGSRGWGGGEDGGGARAGFQASLDFQVYF